MKKVLIYLSVCISIFSNEFESKVNVEEQRIKDLILEKIKIDYNYSQRENKVNYILLNYIYDSVMTCSMNNEKYDTRIFDFFISKGLDINSTNPDFLSEMLDMTFNPKIYEYLIEKGLKYDRVMKKSYSILAPFIVSEYSDEYILKLINNGAKLSDYFPYKIVEIKIAINRGYSDEVINKLLDMVEDKESLAENALISLEMQTEQEDTEVVKKIFRYLQKEKISLDNPKLFELALEKEYEDTEIYEMLFEGGLNPKTIIDGYSLLAMAVCAGNTEVTEVLLKKGADPNSLLVGMPILGYAQNDEVYEVLIKYGAKK